MARPILGRGAAPACLALSVLAFFAPVLVGRCFYLKDTQLVVYPMRLFLREQLLALRLPEWLPGLDLGMPFLANPSNGVLYPLNAVLLLPAPWCVGAFVLCHSVLAAIGALWLLRDLGVRTHAAVIGALGFALGGYMVSLTWVANYMMSLAWLPLVLLFARRTLRRGRLGDAALCGACWALQLLSGEPQGVVLTGWVLLAFALGYPLPWRTRARRGALLGLSLAVALGLALPQVLPALELIPRSRRAEGIALVEASHWSFHPLRLLELCVPWLFGNPLRFDEFFGFFMNDEGGKLHRDPWMVTPYFGSVPLLGAALAAWAPRRRHRHWVRSLGLLCVLSLLLALGRHTPVFGLYFETIPGAQLFRYPAKFFGLCAAVLPLLAAAGADAWLARPHPRFERVVVGLVVVAFGLGFALSGLGGEVLNALRPELSRDAAATVRAALAAEGVLLLAAFGALAWVRRHRPRWLGTALVALSGIQIARVNFAAYETVPASVYAEPELARAIRDATPPGSTPRLIHDVRSLSLPGLDAGRGDRRAHALSNSLMKNTALPWGLGYARSYASSEEGPKYRFWRETVAYRRLLLDVFGIGHLVLPSEAAFPPEANLVRLRQFDPLGAAVYENPAALPFAYPVARVGMVDSFERATLALSDPRIARGELAVLGPLSDPLPSREGGGGRCTLLGPVLDQIDLECELTAPSWVVVNASHHPNWVATVEGRAAPVVPANALVMAVFTPEGRHRLRLRYEEPSLLPAGLASACTALLVSLLVLRDRRTRRASSRRKVRPSRSSASASPSSSD